MSYLIRESFVNLTRGCRYGESDLLPIDAETPGEIFRDARGEYGRCTGKVYVDLADRTVQVGWVFQARVPYDDCPETYLREVWITVYEQPDTITPHYAELAASC